MTGRRDATRWLVAALAGLVILATNAANATDVRHWHRKPIDITLPVGQERIVVVGAPVRVGLPSALADTHTLRVQSTGGAIYLKAKKPFPSHRVQLQDANNGHIILLNVSAKAHAPDTQIRIVGGRDKTTHSASSGSSSSRPNGDGTTHAPGGQAISGGAPMPVRLVRHAAQALYAPHRLIHASRGIHRAKLASDKPLSNLLPSLPVKATPLAAWRGGRETVTAVEITNQAAGRRFRLDPRALNGDFVAASFMQSTLGRAHTDQATTTVFIVTDHGGLTQALNRTHVDSEADNGGD